MIELDIHAPFSDKEYVSELEASRAKAIFSIIVEAAEINPAIPVEGRNFSSCERGIAWQQYAKEFSNIRSQEFRDQFGSDRRLEHPSTGYLPHKIGAITLRDIDLEISERAVAYEQLIPESGTLDLGLKDSQIVRITSQINENWENLHFTGNQYSLPSVSNIIREMIFTSTLRRLSLERSAIIDLATVSSES